MEIVQHVRSQGSVPTHPEEMPRLPLGNLEDIDKMEKCLLKNSSNWNYLVSILPYIPTPL